MTFPSLVAILSFSKTERFKKYFFNTGWMFIERVLSLGLLFIVGILVARYLGPQQFGVLNYAISIAALASPLCFLGLEGIVTREIVKSPKQSNEILGTSFVLMLSGCLTAFILVLIFSFLTSSNDLITQKLLIIIALSLIFECFYTIQCYYQAKVLMKYIAISLIISVFIASLFRLALIFYHFDLIWFGAAVTLQKIILTISILLFYIKNVSPLKFLKFNFSKAKSLLKDSWPLLLSSLSTIIYMYIDLAMLMWMKGSEDVGKYAIVVKISEAWYFIPTIICGSVFPAIISAREADSTLYKRRLFQLYKLMILIALLVAIPISIFSKPIIQYLFGSPYLSASNILAIHIWAGVFIFLNVASSKYLIAENLTKISFFRTFFGMITNVFLNILWIPRYGITGAAFATVVSYAIGTFSILFYPETHQHGLLMLKAFFYNRFKES